jgi:hypothetical protein
VKANISVEFAIQDRAYKQSNPAKVVSFYTYFTKPSIQTNGEQLCDAFDFQFVHPSMRFLPAAGALPAVTQFRELRVRAARRRVGEANWVTIIPAIPPIAASRLSSRHAPLANICRMILNRRIN